ncbi:MAG: Vitamin B12 import ATP-binding protein BtuD [Planctomycetes bacterium]|nr:Vitamin B12 import ATP-binding protein BtuD [Planctomycetota bacterium]
MRRIQAWLCVLAFAMLVAAVATAVNDSRASAVARRAAFARIDAARKAFDGEIASTVASARAALAAGDMSAAPPPPIDRWGGGTETELTVEFLPRNLAISENGRSAKIRYETLAARAQAVAAVGPPVGGRASSGNYEHLAVADDTGRVLFRMQGDPKAVQERHRHRFDKDHESKGVEALAKHLQGRGGLAEPDDDGNPPTFRGGKSERVLATWSKLSAAYGEGRNAPRFGVLVEMTEGEALRDTGGLSLRVGAQYVGRAKPWHVLLGGALLTGVVAAFLWVGGRQGRISSLLRVYSFAKPYRWGILVVIVLGGLFSASQMLKIKLGSELFDDVLVDPGADALDRLRWLSWATLGVGVLMAGTGFLRDYLQNFYATQMIADVRVSLGAKLVRLPLSFYGKHKLGDLVARLERDVASLRNVLNQVFETAFTAPFVLAGALLLAFVTNWGLALILLGLPLLVFPLYRIARKVKKRAETRQLILAEISHVIFQMMIGIKVVKAFSGETRETERLDEVVHRYRREARKLQRLSAMSKALMDLMQMGGGALLVWYGGKFVLAGRVSVGDLFAFTLIVQTCYQQSKEITSVINKLIEAVPGTERVFEIFDEPDTLPDGADRMPRGPLSRGIELRGVRFAYRKKDILRGIDLVVPAGKVVALVGPTGAGKTTICDLVARFYDPTEGAVLFDGRDARSVTKESLLANVAIVTQDAFLFNASIEENIRYGCPGATREQVEQAARDAFVHDEIARMEGGYGKMAGERGTSLSGGQRQRVTIARAILKDAPVLILDEATSALDSHAESQVQAALAKLMHGRTVIVVAHRLSTIRDADHVVVLDQGAIVEQGPPSLLMDREGGRFKEMWDRQMGERKKAESEGGDSSGDADAGSDDDEELPA